MAGRGKQHKTSATVFFWGQNVQLMMELEDVEDLREQQALLHAAKDD